MGHLPDIADRTSMKQGNDGPNAPRDLSMILRFVCCER